MLPEKFAHSSAGIRILEATVAQRVSIAVKFTAATGQLHSSKSQDMKIVREVHTVIGLRLSGMDKIGYVWAKTESPSSVDGGRMWGDVRLAGLRSDIPAPFLGLPEHLLKAGSELMVVTTGSMIKPPEMIAGGLGNRERPCI